MTPPQQPARWRSEQGMTLMELVVGLVITGLVVTTGYAAFASVVDHRQRADEATAALARAATVRHTLTSWLAGARLSAEAMSLEFRGLDGVHEGWPDDELVFLTTSPTPLGVSHTLVRLYIDREDETPERGLAAELVEWRGAQTLRLEIDPHVAGLDLRFVTGLRGERRWLPSWISTTLLPAGIEMTLIPEPESELAPLLRLPILVSLGGGI